MLTAVFPLLPRDNSVASVCLRIDEGRTFCAKLTWHAHSSSFCARARRVGSDFLGSWCYEPSGEGKEREGAGGLSLTERCSSSGWLQGGGGGRRRRRRRRRGAGGGGGGNERELDSTF
eukprot:754381-Hanusia_phi.AAC.1